MKRVAIVGAAGRMGRMLVRMVRSGSTPGLELSGAVDVPGNPEIGRDAGLVAGVPELGVAVSADLGAAARGADVAVDFSGHEAVLANAAVLAEAGVAWVLGTTGLSAEELAAVKKAAERVPVVMAPNMSLGINLLLTLLEEAAGALRGRGYDVEIVERHHRRKKDSPSGTALALGEAVARGYEWALDEVSVHGRGGLVGERPAEQIGFHAVRGGDIVGDHTVLFAADGECIEFSHRATSREAFARGALQAADWAVGRAAGLYTMRDVLGV